MDNIIKELVGHLETLYPFLSKKDIHEDYPYDPHEYKKIIKDLKKNRNVEISIQSLVGILQDQGIKLPSEFNEIIPKDQDNEYPYSAVLYSHPRKCKKKSPYY